MDDDLDLTTKFREMLTEDQILNEGLHFGDAMATHHPYMILLVRLHVWDPCFNCH